MSLFLRKIKKGNWYRPGSLAWLAEGELPADPLGDLVTKEKKTVFPFGRLMTTGRTLEMSSQRLPPAATFSIPLITPSSTTSYWPKLALNLNRRQAVRRTRG